MEAKKKLLTYAGLKALEDELENLKVVKRREIAQKIKEAREQGDLSENAEYDAAKDEQRDIEARIEELEAILKNAEVVVEDEVDFDKINIGCTVKVFDIGEEQREGDGHNFPYNAACCGIAQSISDFFFNTCHLGWLWWGFEVINVGLFWDEITVFFLRKQNFEAEMIVFINLE